jgi:hypothetical protein
MTQAQKDEQKRQDLLHQQAQGAQDLTLGAAKAQQDILVKQKSDEMKLAAEAISTRQDIARKEAMSKPKKTK